MKWRTFLAAATHTGVIASCSEPYQATDTVVVAPATVRTSFMNQYPYSSSVIWYHYDPVVVNPVDWEFVGWSPLDENDYLVRFTLDGEEYYGWYDDAGNWVGSAYVITDYSRLPTAVTNTINNTYNNYTVTSVTREFQRDRMVYEVEIKNSTTKQKLLIDANGNVLKSKTKPLY